MYFLETSDDLGRKIEFPLNRVRTVIGREADCDIVLADEDVSRKHAKLYLVEGRVEVRDMGSRNGIYVNNARIDGMRTLAAGDEIIIGSNLFHLREREDAAAGEIDMTAFRTVDQLRDPLRDFDTRGGGQIQATDAGRTMFGSRDDLLAGIYGKKISLARYPSIEVIGGKRIGAKFLILPGKYVVGRADDANIRVEDDKVSHRHGELTFDGQVCRYLDLGSTNGSIINNRVKAKATLRHKDVLVLGGTKLKYLDVRSAGRPARMTAAGAEGSAEAEGEAHGVPWTTILLAALAAASAGAVALYWFATRS